MDSKAAVFTELFQVSCAKEATLHEVMALVEKASMVKSLLTKTSI